MQFSLSLSLSLSSNKQNVFIDATYTSILASITFISDVHNIVTLDECDYLATHSFVSCKEKSLELFVSGWEGRGGEGRRGEGERSFLHCCWPSLPPSHGKGEVKRGEKRGGENRGEVLVVDTPLMH